MYEPKLLLYPTDIPPFFTITHEEVHIKET